MATRPAKGRRRQTSQDTTAAVDAFMRELRHPFKAEIEALRDIVVGAGHGIQDPDGLLKWLAKDRALVEFTGMDDLVAKRPALQAIVRQWVKHV